MDQSRSNLHVYTSVKEKKFVFCSGLRSCEWVDTVLLLLWQENESCWPDPTIFPVHYSILILFKISKIITTIKITQSQLAIRFIPTASMISLPHQWHSSPELC